MAASHDDALGLDIRLWKSFDQEQKFAAQWLARAHHVMTAPVGLRQMRYDPTRVRSQAGAPVLDDSARVDLARRGIARWVKDCRTQGVEPNAVLDVLVFAVPLRTVDSRHRRRKGWARYNLKMGLDLICVQKGWKAAAARAAENDVKKP